MDYTKLFYWLVVADNARSFFWFFAVVFAIIVIVSVLFYFGHCYTESEKRQTEEDVEVQKTASKWFWWSFPFLILFWAGIIFTPNKKDSLLIVAGGGTLNYLTTDSTAQQIPKELSNFVVTQIKTMAKENEVDLNIKDQKNKILEEAKQMTTEEVLNKIKTDSIYKKVLLEN